MNLSWVESSGAAVLRLALDRCRLRQAQGVPTFCVLVGPPVTASSLWQEWSKSIGWQPRVVELAAPGGVKSNPPTLADSPNEAVLFIHRPSPRQNDMESGEQPNLAQCVEYLCRGLAAPASPRGPTLVGLAVEHPAAEAYLRDEPYSRNRALFAEGMIRLPTTGAQNIPLPGVCGPNPETSASFDAAVTPRREAQWPVAAAEGDDRARSAAERFLFDLLGELPETTGLFELNARLEFCFGPMPAEIDLLARSLHLAVEIDGFHHFRDPDRYRRDRRKDALLQRQGYLVLRFLAEDVVVRLEAILEEIVATVAFLRATRARKNS